MIKLWHKFRCMIGKHDQQCHLESHNQYGKWDNLYCEWCGVRTWHGYTKKTYDLIYSPEWEKKNTLDIEGVKFNVNRETSQVTNAEPFTDTRTPQESIDSKQ